MGRYSRNIRPIYGADEPTWGESAAKGIGSAIELYLRNKAANTSFENDVAMQGGTVDPAESVGDRVRRIGTAIKKRLPGYNPLPDAEANMARGPQPGAMVGATPSADNYPNGVVPIQGPRNASMDTRATARDGLTRSPIADAIERTIIKGPNGQSAIVPTKRGQRQQEVEDQLPLIEARSGAAERERLETMRGDNALRLEQERQRNRQSLEDDKQAARAELERIRAQRVAARASGNTMSDRRLAVMEENAQARLLALGVGIDKTLATERNVSGLDRTIASRDPEQAAQIAATDASKVAARGRLQSTRKGLPTPKTFSSDPAIRRAQELWDNNPSIQKVRKRPS